MEGPADFTIPWPPFPFGSNRSKKARGNAERFRQHVRDNVTPQRVLEGPVAVTLRFLLPSDQRLCDLDGLVEHFLNALQGHCFRSDIDVIELHAFRERVHQNPRIELRLEDRTDQEMIKKKAEELYALGFTPKRVEELKTTLDRAAARGK